MKLSHGEIGNAEVAFAGNETSMRVGDFVLSAGGLKTIGMPDASEFSKMVSFLVWVSRNQPWWLGDVITWGEQRFGDELYNTIDIDQHAIDQITRCAGVARAMPPEARNKRLWFTHHREVCSLPRELAIQKLREAERQVMSSAELRKTIKKPVKKKRKKRKW